MSFQTCETYVHLQNTKIFLLESERFLTLHRQQRSKDIGKLVHQWLNFFSFFFCKAKK